MRNFDEGRKERLERERSFQIGGEKFTYRASVSPEAYIEWSKMVGGEFEELTEEQSLAIFDRTIVTFLDLDLDPSQEERWRSIRALKVPTENRLPVTLEDMKEVVRFLFGENAGRPTMPSSASSGGSGTERTTTTSTEKSSSPAEAVSKA